jgi:hypothetical protein
MAESPHNRQIARAAREVLRPIGCFQKGRSRVWLDDHGWWVGVIEFQPSSWSKGSYLNVGACWLWTPKNFLSFDAGYRVDGFEEYKGDAQFENAASELADRAKTEVLALRERFPSFLAVAKWIVANGLRPIDIWPHFHFGIACGLDGDVETAQAALQTIVSMQERDVDWVRELKGWAENLLLLIEDQAAFRAAVEANIAKARMLLKLPQWPGALSQ